MRWSATILQGVAVLTVLGSVLLFLSDSRQFALSVGGVVSAAILWALSDIVNSLDEIAYNTWRSSELLARRFQQQQQRQPAERYSERKRRERQQGGNVNPSHTP